MHKSKRIKQEEKLNNMKGITLIALVITIILLLILVGVTLAAVTGDYGLFGKAGVAAESTKIAQYKEAIELANTEVIMDNYADRKNAVSITDDGYISRLQEAMKHYDNLKKAEASRCPYDDVTDNQGIIDVVTEEGYVFEVSGDGVEYVEEHGENAGDTKKLTVNISATTVNEYVPPTPDTPEGGTLYTDTTTGRKVPVPAGFSVDTKENTVSGGLVIRDDKEHSEFVWVPVDFVVAESEEEAEEKFTPYATITIEASSNSGIASIENITEEKDNMEEINNDNEQAEYKVTENSTYKFKVTDNDGNEKEEEITIEDINTEAGITLKAMAVKNGNNYRGLLYNFTADGSTVIAGCTTTNFTSHTTNTSSREPDIVTGAPGVDVAPEYKGTQYDAESGYYHGYSNENEFLAVMESEYNAMIQSVEKYKGFYVGRYEMSLTDATDEDQGTAKKAQSIGGVKSATANNSTNMWYGLYKIAKTYKGSKEAVESSMIWGSQWDAMMNWMQENNVNVASKTPLPDLSFNNSNVTGSQKNDKILNVYDTIGSNCDLTMEAASNSYRVFRGGRGFDGNGPGARQYTFTPGSVSAVHTTRLILVIPSN